MMYKVFGKKILATSPKMAHTTNFLQIQEPMSMAKYAFVVDLLRYTWVKSYSVSAPHT